MRKRFIVNLPEEIIAFIDDLKGGFFTAGRSKTVEKILYKYKEICDLEKQGKALCVVPLDSELPVGGKEFAIK